MYSKKLQTALFSIGTKVGFIFLDPELIKQVHQNADAFKKNDGSLAITYLFSNSLLFVKGKEWQRQRQFLAKSFNFQDIKNYLPIFKDVSSKIFGLIRNNLEISGTQEIEIVKTCEKVTSEAVFRVFFGQTSQNLMVTSKDGSSTLLAHELVAVVVDSFHMLLHDKLLLIKFTMLGKNSINILPTQSELKLLNRLKEVKRVCLEIVEKRRNELLKDQSQFKNNFLDQYLKETLINQNKLITDEEIIENFIGLFFAGTDTTGNMTGVALYYLSLYPEIQQKAREEIQKVLSSKCNSNENLDELFNSLTFEDLQQLDLINSILKESLRLIPPAPSVFPRIAERDIKIGDFQLKKGDFVNTYFIYNFYNPDQFSNPEVFDPYRWMNQNESQNVFNFTPFSLGPRNCIGQHFGMIEGKCMLIYALLNFDILPNKNQEVKKIMGTIYGFEKDNLVYFKKRNINN
ncbi:cytochrome P450 family monooxygenase (macronuclear) [Tetrahymena thermophila SB210]|uniref:Cytochrome P450 family monooxygenase n=2 Tax=Tetrahymena thermophila TaxID=5911 RepID=Q22NJ2_TETTS|nr:cytochrome P450 family monooxygenase [Tetrahymena thermophila SB210]EAR86793.2 cytochrome P450 family monooxygenase [Tetrahymena thermophila SB210]|eukprot:XP_001007038.2 cytochrome P450 family monooxygenase [Tetrahymena thermophila SB210]